MNQETSPGESAILFFVVIEETNTLFVYLDLTL